MLPAVDADPLPRELLRCPSAAAHPLEAGGEMFAQAQQESLRGTNSVACEGEDGILLGIRGHTMTVVPFRVAGLEVTPQLRNDGQIFDLVTRDVPGDPNDVVAGLSVLVLPQDDLAASRGV